MLVPITSPHTPGVASAHSSEPECHSPQRWIQAPLSHLLLSGWSPVPRTPAPGRGHPARDRLFNPVIFWESFSTQRGIGPDNGLREEAKGAGGVLMLLDYHPVPNEPGK